MAEQQHRQHFFNYMKHVQNKIEPSGTTSIDVIETIKVLNNKRSTDMFEISNAILKTVNPAVFETIS